MNITVKLGQVTVDFGWDMEAEEPKVETDVQIEDGQPFPIDAVLSGLANALRKSADGIDKERERLAPTKNPPISDEEY